MIMKLVSLLEYVLRFEKPTGYYTDQIDYYEGESNAMQCVISYANFLNSEAYFKIKVLKFYITIA